MQFDIRFLHISSINIILLLFIFAAIGHILQDGPKGKFLSHTLYKYFHIMLFIAIVSGVWMTIQQPWLWTLPNYKYKIFMSIILVITSILFFMDKNLRQPYRSIITVAIFMIIYSISMYIGSYGRM